MSDPVGQEEAHIGLVINSDKTKSLAIIIKQLLAPDYNQLSMNLLDGYQASGSCQIFGEHHRQCWRMLETSDVPWCHHCDIKLATKLRIYRTTALHQLCWMETKHGW